MSCDCQVCTCMHKICTKKVGMTMEFVTTSISLTPRPRMANFCMWPLNYVHINLLKHLSLVDIPNVQWTLAYPATVEPNHGQVYKWNSRICESSCYNASLLALPLLPYISALLLQTIIVFQPLQALDGRNYGIFVWLLSSLQTSVVLCYTVWALNRMPRVSRPHNSSSKYLRFW